MKIQGIQSFILLLVICSGVVLTGCKSEGNNPGREYAPQMYHSVPYESLSQIKDEAAGTWLSNREDEKGEFYNSNPNNPHKMNMREPVEGTVARTSNGYLPYRIHKDSLAWAAKYLKNPLPNNEAILADGKSLYLKFCSACHGEKGKADGKVSEVFMGVAAYDKGQVKTATEGHIYHVITHGKGLMGSHASQLNIEERWKIVRYVQTLQK